MTGSVHGYCRKCCVKIDKRDRRKFDGVMIYFWWNVWKERNRRTFQQRPMQSNQVAMLCKDEITQQCNTMFKSSREWFQVSVVFWLGVSSSLPLWSLGPCILVAVVAIVARVEF